MSGITDRRRAMREEVREKIQAAYHLNQIIEILDDVTLTAEDVPVARLKIDGHFKLLGKVLPDLKATEVEVSGEITHEHAVITLAADDE